MSRQLERQMIEDRTLRNAARALVDADIDHLKADLKAKGIASRFADRMTEGAVDVFEEAVEVAEDKKGVLATLIAAIVIWFARNPVMSLFDDHEASDGGSDPIADSQTD